MNCPIGTQTETGWDGDEFARIVSELLRGEDGAGEARTLGCVWSALDGCTCGARIPEAVVASAWQRELDASGERADGFFHFIWEGGVWLAYGLASGEVRGVHCPSHNSERAARSHAAICGAGDGCGAGEIVYELPLAA
ncbi:MAG TPA: hypothetical protein VGX69_06075 [Solirubrobacteraceae bacterium]|nr:hypothetical protein [Solirubrobacteraceae bacterium]